MLTCTPVVTHYERGGGKRPAHSWVEKVNSLGALSYIAVQVYAPPDFGNQGQFQAIHGAAHQLQTFTFVLISPDVVLLALRDPVNKTLNGRIASVQPRDFDIFKTLSTSKAIGNLRISTAGLVLGRKKAAAKEEQSKEGTNDT
jgi:hypothetical protein